MFCIRVPMDIDTPSPEPLVHSFIHSFIYVCWSPQKGALLHKGEDIRSLSMEPHADRWGAVWFPKGIVNGTAISNPVPCSPQHDTFQLGLGRSACHSNPHQGIPPTTVTTSHVTQGRVRMYDTLRCWRRVGFMGGTLLHSCDETPLLHGPVMWNLSQLVTRSTHQLVWELWKLFKWEKMIGPTWYDLSASVN
jgi:hypothetical protein